MKRRLGFIFLAAFLIRLIYIFALPPRSLDLDDSAQWNLHARHYLSGGGFLIEPQGSDLIRPPLYPLFLAANYKLFGAENYRAAKISQAFLDAGVCVLAAAIAFELFGAGAGAAAGLVAAFYPPLIVYSEILQSENLFILLVTGFAFFLVRGGKEGRWLHFLLGGWVLGLSNLCRGTLLYLPLLMLAVPISLRDSRAQAGKYLTLALVSFALLAPWTYRNWRVYGEFIPIRPRTSELFWFGTMPLSVEKQYGAAPEFKALAVPEERHAQEAFFKNLAWVNIRRDPWGYAVLAAKKFAYFWTKPVGHELIQKRSQWLARLALAGHLLLLLLALNGLLQSRDLWRTLLPLYLLFAYFAAIHTLLMPMPRFRLPLEPLLIVFAVAGASKLWRSGHDTVIQKIRERTNP